MARIDWVVQRLEEWSRWCRQSDAGGLGYPKQAAFLRVGSGGVRGGSVDSAYTTSVAETKDAVESLKAAQRHLYEVLTMTYAQGLPRHLVAKRLCKAESTVYRNLEDGDRVLALWFNERKAQRDRMAALQV